MAANMSFFPLSILKDLVNTWARSTQQNECVMAVYASVPINLTSMGINNSDNVVT